MTACLLPRGKLRKLSTRQTVSNSYKIPSSACSSWACPDRVEDESAALFLPAQFSGVSVPANAIASTPPRTPADFAADMALGGSGHANAINSYPTRATCFADLRDHAVRLMKRCDGHGLRRRAEG
jgi:hypothetical protein